MNVVRCVRVLVVSGLGCYIGGVGLNHSTSFVLVTFYQLTLSGRTTQISRMTNVKLLRWGNFVLLITLERLLTSLELVQF